MSAAGEPTAGEPRRIRPIALIAAIAAVAENGALGRDGGLPWRLPADLKRFKRLTLGHHLILGRRTWETLDAPLPGRIPVVVTRRAGLPEDVLQAATVGEALADRRCRREIPNRSSAAAPRSSAWRSRRIGSTAST